MSCLLTGIAELLGQGSQLLWQGQDRSLAPASREAPRVKKSFPSLSDKKRQRPWYNACLLCQAAVLLYLGRNQAENLEVRFILLVLLDWAQSEGY